MKTELCEGNWKGDNWVHVMCDKEVPHEPHEVDVGVHNFDPFEDDGFSDD